jgi:hypothetical protein
MSSKFSFVVVMAMAVVALTGTLGSCSIIRSASAGDYYNINQQQLVLSPEIRAKVTDIT